MVKIEATEQELQVLAGLIDTAVRSLGVRAANDALFWVNKIQEAINSPKEEKPRTPRAKPE